MFEQFLRTRRLTALVMVATVVLGACSSAASPTSPPATQPPAATQPPVASPLQLEQRCAGVRRRLRPGPASTRSPR